MPKNQLIDGAAEEVLFDADRDNDGVGVSPDEIIMILKPLSQAGKKKD
jgi:hypothetical protein